MTKVSTPLQGGIFTPRHVRILKISVAIMTALLLLGIVALIFGVARQASKLGMAANPAAVAAGQQAYVKSLDLAQGKLETVAVSGDLLVLHWKGEGIDVVLTINPRDGRELGRIQIPHR